jgi:hypothetical protein
MLAILTMGGLYFLISNLTPEAIEARRQEKTNEALSLARDALFGYVLKYRDEETAQGRRDRMYGYLPLPDLGSGRNGNAGCTLEGCDANTFTGIAYDANGIIPTVVGRFPWRTLGTGPLRDGHGECLWLIVSSLHSRIHRAAPDPVLPPMNWDTLGQLDIVTANGGNALVSALVTSHDRPIAIIYSPGHPLGTQDRSNLGGNDVTECGGNYDAANYLDPAAAAALGGITNYLAGANNTSGVTGDSDPSNDPDNAQKKNMLTQGKVFKSVANYLPGGCSAGNCELLANDVGLPVTGDALFGALRKSSNFRTDLNSMLDRMTSCLRDQIAAGPGFTPDAMSNFAVPGDKSAGRVPANACYDDSQNPQGYFTHWRDQFFVARANAGSLSVKVDGVTQACPAVLLLGGQRRGGQLRDSAAARGTPSNYLEDDNLGDGGASTTDNNLLSFGTDGQVSFAGPGTFGAVSAVSPGQQDIVRCIPPGASFTTVGSPVLASLGFDQLAAYDPGTRTLTLGASDVTTGEGAPGYALYGCSWTPEAHLTKAGLRAYFRFAIVDRGDGFVFAMIDGDRNAANVCGAARQQLGYSGNNDPDQSSNGLAPSIPNNETPIIAHPKIGIEFDNTKAFGTYRTSGDPTSAGRNDPCYASGSCPPGASGDNNAHAAIVYWGGESTIATGVPCNAYNQCPYTGTAMCTTPGRCPAVRYCNTIDNMCYLRPEYDDNVHSFPVPPDASPRPAPRNPPAPFPAEPVASPAPGVAALDRLGSSESSEREFHVRVEVTRIYSDIATTDPMNRKATVKVETWIVAEGGNSNQIAAVKNTTRAMSQLYPGFAPTLSNDGIRYSEPRGACVAGVCAAGQTCDAGTCYTSGPPEIHDLPMGGCVANKCNGPPLLKRNACVAGACPAGSGQSCGADNFCYDALYSCSTNGSCYAEAFRSMRLGFTNGQGTQDQVINITDFFATWLP